MTNIVSNTDIENYDGQFFIGDIGEEGVLAVSKVTNDATQPYFCVQADTEEAVIAKALRALSFYAQYKTGGTGLVVLKNRLPVQQIEQHFVPKEVIFASAAAR